MSGRIFQNVVLQFKETTDRTIGVIDADGTVIACSELTGIGKKWSKYVEPIAAAEGGASWSQPDFSGFEGLRYLSPAKVIPYNFSSGCPWRRCRRRW